MARFVELLAALMLSSAVTACEPLTDLLKSKDKSANHDDDDDDDEDADDDDKPKKKKKKKDGTVVLADIGFKPERDGFRFANTGGEYPRSTPVVDQNVLVKLFGAEACVGGDTEDCTPTLPALEWSHMINRAMNGGQCEGMAVASLTFFKRVDKPDFLLNVSAHNIDRKEATPYIGYYWAYQTLDPVMSDTRRSRRTSTPNSVEDQLVEMFKKGELATLGFWNPRGRGGHAVTPYAVEDKGNGIHWIKVYDNNFPDKERYITIDRNANTWKYDLAALNPSEPKVPWYGDAALRNLVVIPLDLRLQKAACPFCSTGLNKKMVWARASSLSITDGQGRKVSASGDTIVNEIEGAEVVDIASYLDGVTPAEPIFFLPEDADYDIAVTPHDGPAPTDPSDVGLTVLAKGEAIAVDGVKLQKGQSDTLSLPRERGSVRYKSGSGTVPSLKLAVADEKDGAAVRISNLQADPDGEIELRHDRKLGRMTVQGAGKATQSYDLELSTVQKGDKGVEKVQEKGVRFKLGEAHGIDARRPARNLKGPKAKDAKPAPIRISRGAPVRRITPNRPPKPEEGKPATDKPLDKKPITREPSSIKRPVDPPKAPRPLKIGPRGAK